MKNLFNYIFSNKYLTIAFIVIVIIIILTIYKNWDKIINVFHKNTIIFEPGESTTIPDLEKRQLESVANSIFSDIYDTPITGHDGDVYKEALALTDNRLAYVNDFYKSKVSGGKSIIYDLNDEYFFQGSDALTQANKLISRLKAIGFL